MVEGDNGLVWVVAPAVAVLAVALNEKIDCAFHTQKGSIGGTPSQKSSCTPDTITLLLKNDHAQKFLSPKLGLSRICY